MSLTLQFQDALVTALSPHGFKRQSGLTFVVELGNGVSGWVGFNMAKRGGPPYTVIPNAGLCHEEIQRTVSKLRGYNRSDSMASPICGSSLSDFIGGPPNGLAWSLDSNSLEKIVREIETICSGKLMKFLKKQAHPEKLIELMLKGFGESTSNAYCIPLLYSRIGKPQMGLAYLDQVDSKMVVQDFYSNRDRLRALL